jgi:helix-turn-helix protein
VRALICLRQPQTTLPAYRTAKDKPHAGFLTTEEAGEVLGVCASTVRWYIRTGRLTALRKRWYYGHLSGRNLRVAYFIPINEIKRYGMRMVVEKYARPTAWVRAKDDPAAIMEAGE